MLNFRQIKFAITSLLLTNFFNAFSQTIDNYSPCEGESITLSAYNMFPSDCVNPTNGDPNIYDETNYYTYSISYSGGTFGVMNATPLNTPVTTDELQFTLSPNSYFNPVSATVSVSLSRKLLSTQAYQVCNSQSFTIFPKKNFNLNGPSVINAPGNITYSTSSISGVTNYNWYFPSGWIIVSGQGTNVVTVTPNANSGNVGVNTSPAIQVCKPTSKFVKVTDCFTYGESSFNFCTTNNWGSALSTSQYGDINKFPRLLGDFNGDDQTDIIGFGNTAVNVGISNGSTFNTTSWSTGFTYGGAGYTQLLYQRNVGDFNGDGKDDIIGFGHTQTAVGISTGTSFNSSLFTPIAAFNYTSGYTDNNILPRLIGDVTGDGKDDVVAFGHHDVAVGVSNGSSFNVSNWSGGSTFSNQTGGFSDMNKWPKMLGDFDGDGKMDIIGFGNTNVIVGISNGSGAFSNSTWTTSFTYGTDGFEQKFFPRYLGDFNGDGKTDIIAFGHTGIIVGISTGSSFNVSNWLTGEEFCYDTGWRVDAREIELGYVSAANYAGKDVIRIIDANGDGLDDIVGFNGDGVFIAYSNGTHFKCPAHSNSFSTVGNITQPTYPIIVGQFDVTDDEIEIAAMGYSEISMMNCDNCPNSIASAIPINYEYSAQESGYQGWTVDVYNYCSNSVVLDLTGTSCENNYFITVDEFDLNNWSIISTPYNQQWANHKAPDYLNLSNSLTFVTGKLYKITYAVGPDWNSKTIFVRISQPVASFEANSPSLSTRTHYFLAAGQFKTIYRICSNVLSMTTNGSMSYCDNQYNYELQEVDISTMNPIGSPILQIPSGGGWNNGSVTLNNISTSSFVNNKIYRLTLRVKNSAGTISTTYKYFDKDPNCTITPVINPRSINKGNMGNTNSVVYPNPTSSGYINIKIGDYSDENITIKLLNIEGREILSEVTSSRELKTVNVLGLSKGTYFFKIIGSEKVENIHFIIE